jgi:hypothetical protein
MKKYLLVQADENDADYLTERNLVTDKQIEKIKPIVAVLNKKGYNWGTSEYVDEEDTPEALYVKTGLLTEEQVEFFNEFVPYGSHGVHTIESVSILVVQEEITLF